jgi:hypothetical protein
MVRPALIAVFTYLLCAPGLAQDGSDQVAPPAAEAPAAEAPVSPEAPASTPAAEDDNALYDTPDGDKPLFGDVPDPAPPGPPAAAPPGEQPRIADEDPDALDAPRKTAPVADEDPDASDDTASLEQAPAPRGQPQWDDASEMGKMLGYGSMGVCEAVTAPLSLIPSIGSIIGFALEIACLYPGALTVDYVALFHGKRDSQLWQAATAVILAKGWRVGTRFAAVAAILAAGAVTLGAGGLLLGGAGVSAFLGGADALTAATPLVWAPTLIGSVLVLAGGTYIGLRKIRKWGQNKIYEWVYLGLTDDFQTLAAQQQAQQKAYVYPPLSWWERAWVLMAMADGSEAPSSPLHWIPVAGRVIKAGDQAAALKGNMRRVGKDMIGEEPEDLAAMDSTIDTLAAFEGGLGALAEAALLGGGVLCTIGLAMSAAWFFLDSNLVVYGLATTAVGLAGMTAGLAGVTFLLLREVPRFLRPFLVPLGYGPVPYRWLEEEQPAGAAPNDGDDADDREME